MSRILIILAMIISAIAMTDSTAMGIKKPTQSGDLDSDYNDYLLIITSYAHDAKMVSEFTETLELVTMKQNTEVDSKIESMGILGLSNCMEWKSMMRDILAKHSPEKLRGIILIGNEAWGTYLSLDEKPANIPFFGYKINETWAPIPDSLENIDDIIEWIPESRSSKNTAARLGQNGALLNDFNIEKNINLALKNYHGIKNIALLTDNSYGGICIQAKFRQQMAEKFPKLNPIMLDGRKYSSNEIKNMIDQLPPKTVIMLGSWRVGRRGSFFLDRTLLEITSGRPDIPLFSISGLGLRNIAIAGYAPIFGSLNNQFVEDVLQMLYSNQNDTIFYYTQNEYQINLENFDKMGLNRIDIPKNAIYVDTKNAEIEKYRNFTFLSILFASIAAIAATSLIIMQGKIKRQNKLLNTQTEELKTAKENAEKSDKLKSAFLANISHEIRTPMNAIMGFASMLHEVDKDTLSEYQKYITDNGKILLELLTQTVEYSKVDSGIVDFNLSNINLPQLFLDIKAKYAPKIPSGINFANNMPYRACTVVYDADKLSWMISILLDNAIKFIRRGTIEMGCMIADQKMVVYVSDTGIGIAEENQKRIFDRFEKLDTFSQGAGLGLSLIKAITEKSGGKISVISQPDVGSRFVIEIPCKTQEPDQGYASQDAIDELYEKTSLLKSELNTSLKILVAEDSTYNFTLLESIMKNHQLIHVENGMEAVKAMQKDWYDLVLMDIKMPEMDGLTATQEIRKFDKQTPIIAVTAFTFDNNFSKAINAGCNDFLEKPFTIKASETEELQK
ncbi:MAG: response regulator, partial [Bacteroidales bacterium]|nr:response regulator [Bacteroidales bacterium]